MLFAFGAKVSTEGFRVSVLPSPDLMGQKVDVAGDISSAAYFIAAGLLVQQNTRLHLRGSNGGNPVDSMQF